MGENKTKIRKLGIVGFGGMAQFHRKEIETIPGISIKGTFDIKEERQAYARDLGLQTYDSLEKLLAEKDLDIVLVATPNDVHKSIAIKALKAGKHVIVEKPATLHSQELQALIECARETKRLLSVHQNRRWDEDYLTMKKIYRENLLGKVFRIESRVHGSRGIPGDWRQLPEHGGGMVLDWGVHLFDQILQLVPEKVKRVYAQTTHITNQLVDDGFYAELTFESGLMAAIEVGTNNFIPLLRWYMLGQDGTAIIKGWNQDGKIVRAVGIDEKDVLPVITAAGLTKTMAPRRKENLREEIITLEKSDVREFYRNYLAVLDGKEESKIQLSEVMRVMKLMEAIFQSADTGRVVGFE